MDIQVFNEQLEQFVNANGYEHTITAKLSMAARNGDPCAMYTLGVRYIDKGDKTSVEAGIDLMAKAQSIFEEALSYENASPTAKRLLAAVFNRQGVCYKNGIHTANDGLDSEDKMNYAAYICDQNAYELIQEPLYAVNLSMDYEIGIGVEANHLKAMEIISDTAKDHNPEASLYAAIIYLRNQKWEEGKNYLYDAESGFRNGDFDEYCLAACKWLLYGLGVESIDGIAIDAKQQDEILKKHENDFIVSNARYIYENLPVQVFSRRNARLEELRIAATKRQQFTHSPPSWLFAPNVVLLEKVPLLFVTDDLKFDLFLKDNMGESYSRTLSAKRPNPGKIVSCSMHEAVFMTDGQYESINFKFGFVGDYASDASNPVLGILDFYTDGVFASRITLEDSKKPILVSINLNCCTTLAIVWRTLPHWTFIADAYLQKASHPGSHYSSEMYPMWLEYAPIIENTPFPYFSWHRLRNYQFGANYVYGTEQPDNEKICHIVYNLDGFYSRLAGVWGELDATNVVWNHQRRQYARILADNNIIWEVNNTSGGLTNGQPQIIDLDIRSCSQLRIEFICNGIDVLGDMMLFPFAKK